MIFENSKVYDILKWLASPGLPAVSALLIAMGQILHIDAFSIAGAIVAAVAGCLGEWTGVSSKKYWAAQHVGGDETVKEEIKDGE